MNDPAFYCELKKNSTGINSVKEIQSYVRVFWHMQGPGQIELYIQFWEINAASLR